MFLIRLKILKMHNKYYLRKKDIQGECTMELIDNKSKTLRDDLSVELKKGSKLSIAAACFSIYAFQELKKELKNIDELRFIFTSPTFVTEKAKRKRENFIYLD